MKLFIATIFFVMSSIAYAHSDDTNMIDDESWVAPELTAEEISKKYFWVISEEGCGE